MVQSNTFAYMRISTKEERELQKFNRQEKAINKYAEDNNISYTLIFKEDKSGSNFKDRTEWNRLESIVKEGDTIIFKDISRFTRQAEEGYIKYMELLDKGINLVFIDNQTISTDYIKELLNIAAQQNLVAQTTLESTVKLLLIVELDRVQKEREILIKRIKDGITSSDKKQGRKQGTLDKMTEELKEDILRYNHDRTITQIELMKKHNISRNTLKKYIKIVNEEV